MKLLISSEKNNQITLTLKGGRKTLDSVDFGFDKNLDTEVVKSIDKFMKRNRIDIRDLDSVEISPNIDKTGVTYKILQTWKQASDFVKNQGK